MKRRNTFEENLQKRLSTDLLCSSVLNSSSLRCGVGSFCSATKLLKEDRSVDKVLLRDNRNYNTRCHLIPTVKNCMAETILSTADLTDNQKHHVSREVDNKLCSNANHISKNGYPSEEHNDGFTEKYHASLTLLQTTVQSGLSKRPHRKRKVIKPQSNNLLNYFKTSVPSNPGYLDSTLKTIPEEDDCSSIIHSSQETDNSSCSSTLMVQDRSIQTESSDVACEDSLGSIDKDSKILELFPVVPIVPIKSKVSSTQACDLQHEMYPNFYGLLGLDSGDDSDFSDIKSTYLPGIVLEMIFCQVPLSDLLMNVNRVCRSWNDIISASRFIPWKKTYHMLKVGVQEVTERIGNSALNAGMDSLESYLLSLITYMNFFSLLPVQGSLRFLQRHTKYANAKKLIIDKVPVCVTGSIPNLWSVVTALVVLSKNVWDVYDILTCLTKGPCPVYDAMEALYCVATFLLYMKRKYSVGYGLHYRVYYALYSFENSSLVKVCDLKAVCEALPGQQTLVRYGHPDSKLNPTNEQMRIINHCPQANHIVKIIAFAGSGKTTTLVAFSKKNPHIRFLMVTYNKAVVEYAKTCFPKNVECRTSHSLAWKTQGSRLSRKLTAKVRPLDILDLLENAPNSYGQRQWYARCVITALERFMASADDFITIIHVPITTERSNQEPYVLSDAEKLNVAKDAETIWQKMIDAESKDVFAVHDCYLKLYHLERPTLYNYDCILIDEAQDCNAAVLDLLLRQSCAKIVVGDPNQQIYAFRGAVNALDKIVATHIFYLTQSFRFGPEIAHVASLILELLKEHDRKTLVGGMQNSSVTGSQTGQVGILARSNIGIFNEAVRLLCTSVQRSYDPEHVVGTFAGGIKGYCLDQLVDIYHLMGGSKASIQDRFIRRFQNIATLQLYAENVNDLELLGKIRLVKQHGSFIPQYVHKIKDKCCKDISFASVVFSTVHKAKGLEFSTVVLLDDFTIGTYPYSPPGKHIQDEFNVLYVGVTRAKNHLYMPPVLYYVLLGGHEKMEYPVAYQEENPNTTCCKCGQNFNILPGKLVLERCQLQLVGDTFLPKGYICFACSQLRQFVPEVAHPLTVRGFQPLPDLQHQMFAQILG